MNQPEWWQTPAQQAWSQRLLDSYARWTGQELVERAGTSVEQCRRLFFAPFVVVSHDNQIDPCLNYGNQAALALWEMDWEQLRNTPSRLTAEPMNRTERLSMLEQAARKGIITDYRGIRISRTGRRFLIERAIVWNVLDESGTPCGQAATFSGWTPLSSIASANNPHCIP